MRLTLEAHHQTGPGNGSGVSRWKVAPGVRYPVGPHDYSIAAPWREPMPDTPKDEKKRDMDERVALPLDPEEALGALLNTPPDEDGNEEGDEAADGD